MLDPTALSYTLEELRVFLPRSVDGEHPDRRAVRRWLRNHDVPIDRVGKCDVVWLADIERAFPQLFRSLELRRRVAA